MVKAMVEIDEEATNAINEMARQYKDVVLKSGVKPEYVRKLMKINEEPIVRIGNARDFRKRYGLK